MYDSWADISLTDCHKFDIGLEDVEPGDLLDKFWVGPPNLLNRLVLSLSKGRDYLQAASQICNAAANPDHRHGHDGTIILSLRAQRPPGQDDSDRRYATNLRCEQLKTCHNTKVNVVGRFVSYLPASLLAVVFAIKTVLSFPAYGSLAGLSDEMLDQLIPRLQVRDAELPPGPLNDTSAKLVNDKTHPWKPLRPNDIRGPCPGLNTLASHGWLPRNGIATPAQIVNAVQEGFNMGNDLAVFVTYGAMLVDGNVVTNLLSIGGKTPKTGPDPPQPAIVGGLNTHAVFEGDASMTRGDAYFGDNHSFNETLFDEFSSFSDRFGGGNYNLTVAAEFRWQRIQDSIATNPNFSLISPRYFTAYAEAVFPTAFFVDGRVADGQLNLINARGFFQNNQMPEDFYRPNASVGLDEVGAGIESIFAPHPIQPGKNEGAGNYVLDPTSANFSQFCELYTNFVNDTVRSLYPSPKGVLLKALNTNLDYFYSPLQGSGCSQVFPYGQ